MSDNEDLLKIAELEPSKKYNREKKDDVQLFIERFNIMPGERMISSKIIYMKYYKSFENPIWMSGFFMKFKKQFKRKLYGTNSFYCLDPTPFDLTDENKKRAELEVRKLIYEKKKRKKEKDEKKQG